MCIKMFLKKIRNHADIEYLNLAKRILDEGVVKDDRTGTGTISLFGPQMEFDLGQGFPLLTTKKLPFRIIAEELLWFIKGDTNLKTLLDKNVNIWNADGYRFYIEQGGKLSYEDFIEKVKNSEEGFDLGPIYGKQWRRWEVAYVHDYNFFGYEIIDQLQNVIDSIKRDPNSRRHYVSAWNPADIDEGALPPCHLSFQFYVANNKLSCKVYLRSNDIFLGNPFNIASYALLTHIVAKMTDLDVGRLILTIGDAHIYLNHVEQIKKQMAREPRQLPKLIIKAKKDKIEDYTIEDFEVVGYEPHGPIRGTLSVGL